MNENKRYENEPISNKDDLIKDLNPEFRAMLPVPLKGALKSYTVIFIIKTARDRFIIQDKMANNRVYYSITITFKQIQNGNLYSNYTGLWYKLKEFLFTVLDRWYPTIQVTKYRLVFVKEFIKRFNNLAPSIIEARIQIENEVGPLPYIVFTLLELELPRPSDGLDIINRNALKMYNAKAKINRWATIRNLDELADMISQKFPKLKCSTARKQYRDIDGKKKRGIVLVCDLHAIAHEIRNILNQLL